MSALTVFPDASLDQRLLQALRDHPRVRLVGRREDAAVVCLQGLALDAALEDLAAGRRAIWADAPLDEQGLARLEPWRERAWLPSRLRYFPGVTAARGQIGSPALGPAVSLHAALRLRRDRAQTLANHLLALPLADLGCWFAGSPLTRVHAVSGRLWGEDDDTITITARFESGMVATLEAARAFPERYHVPRELEFEALTERGSVRCSPFAQRVVVDRPGERQPIEWFDDGSRHLLDEACAWALDGTLPSQGWDDTRAAVRLAALARRSAETGEVAWERE